MKAKYLWIGAGIITAGVVTAILIKKFRKPKLEISGKKDVGAPTGIMAKLKDAISFKPAENLDAAKNQVKETLKLIGPSKVPGDDVSLSLLTYGELVSMKVALDDWLRVGSAERMTPEHRQVLEGLVAKMYAGNPNLRGK